MQARVDIIDHLQARLRHFRAAAAVNDLYTFTKKSLIYEKKVANQIAKDILTKYPYADSVTSNFLLQTALRYKVAEICTNIVQSKKYEYDGKTDKKEVDFIAPVKSFDEAYVRMDNFLTSIDWSCLDVHVTKGNGTTQNDQRVPINLEPFLKSTKHRKIILKSLGLPENANV